MVADTEWLISNFSGFNDRYYIRQCKRQLIVQMPLHELGKARDLLQAKLAEVLRVSQTAVSKIEHRTDMYINTLREDICDMGSDLQIVAKFPEGEVNITNFSEAADRDAAW